MKLRVFISSLVAMVGMGCTMAENKWYENPIINADYSDPDVCVGSSGSDFYMTASSFNCIPGLPILHSTDLVHWKIVNYAIRQLMPADVFSSPQHGKGVWAPCIRYNDETGLYYIYWGDPDRGVFVVTTNNPEGEWSKPQLILEGKGIIDPAIFWDEDGRCYMANAYANSRAHINSIISVREMSADGMRQLTEPRIVFDGNSSWHHTCEGPKMYKRDGYYWIFCPAGGVKQGHQLAMRSKSPYVPYDEKVVLQRGNTDVNGPHQGALVSLSNGNDWFLHFQDKEAYGRVVWLQPVKWKKGWPVIGNNGKPVMKHVAPALQYSNDTIQTSDEFESLGLQWQWNANYQENYGQIMAGGQMRIFCHTKSDNYSNLLEVGNLLLQKLPADHFQATAKLTLSAKNEGQCGGMICMGSDYCALVMERVGDGFVLKQTIYYDDNRSNDSAKDNIAQGRETDETIAHFLPTAIDHDGAVPPAIHLELYLRMEVDYVGGTMPVEYPVIGGQKTTPSHEATLTLSYSTDGKRFVKCGKPFKVRQNKWTGAKIGLMAIQPHGTKTSGWVDADWFRIIRLTK